MQTELQIDEASNGNIIAAISIIATAIGFIVIVAIDMSAIQRSAKLFVTNGKTVIDDFLQ